MSSTTIAPTSNNNTTTSTNGLLNPKTNRTLFKNIKNTNVSNTPNTNLKKNSINNIIGNGPSSNVNKKVNNGATGVVVSDKNNILFTPSKNSMVSRTLATSNVSSTGVESFLDIAAIEKDLKRMEAFTGSGISPMSSPVKNTIPIAIVDLESLSTDDSSKIVATKKPSVVYSVDLLLSFKTANTKRPVQIDIVENHQKEIVVPVSLPSTPYVNNNNHHNNISSNSHNNSQQKYPIFSPQISPFKIAYNSQQQSSSSSTNNNSTTKNTNIITPTKKQQNGSTVTTPQNSYYSNNSNNSSNNKSTKKQQNNQNPIPFSLNTNTTTPKSNKKLTANTTTTTPKSNKKITTTDVTAAFIAATNVTGSHEDEVVAVAGANINNADDSSIVLPSPSKKVAQKETDQKRLAARQRQIDIGKMTAGYKNYIAQVPKSKRKPTDPKTPNKNQVCSKRSWDGQIRIWRRLLHSYDSQGTEFNDEELDREMNALEIACSLISIQSTPTKL